MTSQLYKAVSEAVPSGPVIEEFHMALGGARRARKLRPAQLSSEAGRAISSVFASVGDESNKPRVIVGFEDVHDGMATAAVSINTSMRESIPLVRRAIIGSMHAAELHLVELDPEIATNLARDDLEELGFEPSDSGVKLQAA